MLTNIDTLCNELNCTKHCTGRGLRCTTKEREKQTVKKSNKPIVLQKYTSGASPFCTRVVGEYRWAHGDPILSTEAFFATGILILKVKVGGTTLLRFFPFFFLKIT